MLTLYSSDIIMIKKHINININLKENINTNINCTQFAFWLTWFQVHTC